MSNASRTPSRIGTITFFDRTIPYVSAVRLQPHPSSFPAHTSLLSMIRFPTSSTLTENPGWTTVVESNSSTTAGPAKAAPAASA